MKKKDVLAALEKFDDDDELQLSGTSTDLWGFEVICGKTEFGMGYTCVLPKNHNGECYCACKKLHFIPD